VIGTIDLKYNLDFYRLQMVTVNIKQWPTPFNTYKVVRQPSKKRREKYYFIGIAEALRLFQI
jgi:hypothetical protein